MSEVRSLSQRIIDIMATIGAVEKDGHMETGGSYSYHRIDDIDDRLRRALIQHGVVAVVAEIIDRKMERFEEPNSYGKMRTVWHAECMIRIELINADDKNDKLSFFGWGQGLDYSDKATGKAMSYAAKSAYLSTFHLRGQPDSELESIPAPRVKGAPKLEVTPEQQAAVDEIKGAKSMDELLQIGEKLTTADESVRSAPVVKLAWVTTKAKLST